MFNKKFGIFLITLIFMLSVSAVAAADAGSTDDMVIGDVEEEPPSIGVEDVSSTESDEAVGLNQEEEIVLASDSFEVYYKSGEKYEVSVHKGDNAVNGVKVTISVAGASYNVTTNKNGVASLPINLKVGSYPISSSYGAERIEGNIKVLPVIKASDVTIPYGSSGKYTATFLQKGGQPLENTYVKISVVGKTYTVKTNKNGVATLPIGLKPGKYQITAIHPNGYKISNTITVKSSISSSNFQKYYGSANKFSATFYDKSGKPLANKNVKFQAHGNTYSAATNSKGVAYLSIISKPSSFTVTSINPVTGQKVSNTVNVLSTISAANINGFSYCNVVYKATLKDKNGKLLPNTNVKITANGATKTVKTDSKGVASLTLKYTNKGTYKITANDLSNGCSATSYAYIKLATLKASAMNVRSGTDNAFKVTLTDQNRKAVANKNVEITPVEGFTKTVKTDSNGVATLNFNLQEGTYYFITKDPSTGYILKTKVVVSDGKVYDKYGVSNDGSTLLAIGRASAAGEYSQYGYTFYITEFVRECPYCHSKELYWGIFWAGSETANYGVFPATGNKEGGSAEGHIFCANCDSDWSVFGNNHGGTGGNLKIVTATAAATKDMAYALLKGNFTF